MFYEHMRNFTDTLDGLRSFVDLVGPFLTTKSEQVLKRRAKDLIPLYLAMTQMQPELFKDAGISEKKLKNIFDGKIKLKRKIKGDEESYTLLVTGPQSDAFHEAMGESHKAAERIDLLYRNSLISLISAVESFLSQIIYAYFDNVPSKISDKDKVFSFDDLNNFNSVEDARTYLIEKKIDKLMRESFTDWVNFFRTKADLSMSYLDPYMDTLVETCERRNLLVHNSGIVNTIYLSKVATSLRKGKKKGNKLHLSRKYLDERIDYFEKYSLLIAAELWKKLKPIAHKRGSILGNISYDHIKAARWSVAEGLSYFMMMDKAQKESFRLVGTLNYWQCLKRQGRWAEVEEQATAEDFSAKSLRYQLGHLALLGKKKEFFEIVPVALTGEEITLEELREYPIFIDMRKDRCFSQYKEKRKVKKKSSSDKLNSPVQKSKKKKGVPRKGSK